MGGGDFFFFFFFFFLASVVSYSGMNDKADNSPPEKIASTPRREVADARERTRLSKRAVSTPDPSNDCI
jgi:hypothetical protein